MNAPSLQAATTQHAEEHPAREHPPVPEHSDKQVHAARPAPQKPESLVANDNGIIANDNQHIMPPQQQDEPRGPNHPQEPSIVPHPTPKHRPVHALTPEVANHKQEAPALVLSDETFKLAEQQLATYIGGKIDPKLTDGLILTLKESPKNGTDGIELCFQGPALIANSGLLAEQVIKALHEHPVLRDVVADEKSKPHAEKPTEADKIDMMHIHIGHLSTHRYSTLVQHLAVPPVVAETPAQGTLVAPQHEQIIAKAMANPVVAQTAANEGHIGIVKAEEKPQPSVQAPVAALDKALPQQAQVQI